MPQQV